MITGSVENYHCRLVNVSYQSEKYNLRLGGVEWRKKSKEKWVLHAFADVTGDSVHFGVILGLLCGRGEGSAHVLSLFN